MKISQLVLRENFYVILENTISKNSFFLNFPKNEKKIEFKSFQYLNIIFETGLSGTCRNALVHEYTLRQSKIKSLMQKTYVFFAFLPLVNVLFVHKRLKFSNNLRKYAIVGGNHRIRLFNDDLKSINILLKEGENPKFVTNDIESRKKNNLKYAPGIIAYGDDWLVEEFISGIPFNRIRDEVLLMNSFDLIVNQHMKEFIYKTRTTLSNDKYLQTVSKEMFSQIELIQSDADLKVKLLSTVKSLIHELEKEKLNLIDISMTHGDFQKGNMRITPGNETIVIDWEAADNRFYLYDLFTILSGLREGQTLKKGLSLFFENAGRYDDGINNYSKKVVMLLLCTEELRFYLNEDISLNYFQTGIKSRLVAAEIDSLLYASKIK